jgi:hypothetical protein
LLQIEFAQQFIAAHAVMRRNAFQDTLQCAELDRIMVRNDFVVPPFCWVVTRKCEPVCRVIV